MNFTKEIALQEQGKINAISNLNQLQYYHNQATFSFLKEGNSKSHSIKSGKKITKKILKKYLTIDLDRIHLKIEPIIRSLGI